jgi:hypothetical protein
MALHCFRWAVCVTKGGRGPSRLGKVGDALRFARSNTVVWRGMVSCPLLSTHSTLPDRWGGRTVTVERSTGQEAEGVFSDHTEDLAGGTSMSLSTSPKSGVGGFGDAATLRIPATHRKQRDAPKMDRRRAPWHSTVNRQFDSSPSRHSPAVMCLFQPTAHGLL